MTNAATEQRVLKLSVLLTAVLGGFAVALGLLSGSMSIVFDGLFSVVDVAMGLLGLWIARLVTREENRTFQYGYWHIEPMSLAFYGGMMMVLCVYAFVDAVGSIMAGGQTVELGWAIGYSLIMTAACFTMFFYEKTHQPRRRIGVPPPRRAELAHVSTGHRGARRGIRLRLGARLDALCVSRALRRPSGARTPEPGDGRHAGPDGAKGTHRDPPDDAE